jgi:hypothetical protein
MIKIPIAIGSGGKGTSPIYRHNHPNCYLCENNSQEIIEYFVGKHNFEGDLREFRSLFDKHGLKYAVMDREDAIVEVGACNNHSKNLKELANKVLENRKVLTEEILMGLNKK